MENVASAFIEVTRGTLSQDPSSDDKHVTSAIMSQTEIISVIMAVITLVKLLCSR